MSNRDQICMIYNGGHDGAWPSSATVGLALEGRTPLRLSNLDTL